MDRKGIFTRRNWLEYMVFVAAWIEVNLLFWMWWLEPIHRGNPWLYWPVTFAFFYDGTFLPSMFLYYLGRAKQPVNKELDGSWQTGHVAMISLTVPGSEAIEIVEKQIMAMKAVKYPHDSWILVDKVHSPEIAELAKKHKIGYFCRHDVQTWGKERVENWNQIKPPFKAKTKAGNVNAWIEAFGDNYEFFTQLDIDHIPKEEYLDKVLGYFENPKIAWVQAPSVYGNFEHWTARGAAEQELVLQGPLQMGFYGITQTPFIIGSHSTYRMDAVKEIGGFQPTRAEDHLDTLYLATKGYKGVFLPEVIATGDGPETFEIYLAQQFAWAYSLTQVLFGHAPKALWRLKPKVALQMLFAETWYPLWSFCMLVLFISPTVALVTGQHISVVGFWDFAVRSILISISAFTAWVWSRKWQQPKGLNLSWRGIILHTARWVIVVSAIIQAALRIKKPYMITQKGEAGQLKIQLRSVMPYLVLAYAVLAVCSWYLFRVDSGPTQGYLLFSLEGVVFMGFVVMVPFVGVFKQSGLKAVVKQKLSLAVLVTSFVILIIEFMFAFPLISQAVWPN